MYNYRKITNDLYYIGASDRRLNLFENVYPLSNGVSYNSYLLIDEKTVLFDTVDKSVSSVFMENISHILGDRSLDIIIVNHMEPDHSATLATLAHSYPTAKIVTTAMAKTMISQFFDCDFADRITVVKEGDTLNTGSHNLQFVSAPMVHWPEVMVTYDSTDKILFSADAFGTFGALSGNIFDDELDFNSDCEMEARRYYTNIVGKYGAQVQALLKKAKTLDIQMVCALHGPIIRKNIGWFVEKYDKWSSYTPEEDGVVIAYASIYGNTENVANVFATKLAENGIRNIKMYDVSVTHPSYVIAEIFKYSHLVLLSSTYNAGIFVNMENLLHDLLAHNFQNRKVCIVENGSWAITSGALMKKMLENCKNVEIIGETLTVKSALKSEQLEEIDLFVNKIIGSMNNNIKEAGGESMKYVCDVCGWVYDETEGYPEGNIAPGTKWEDLPEDFACPLCSVGKDSFSKE